MAVELVPGVVVKRPIGALIGAAERGYRMGRARVRVTPEDIYDLHLASLQDAFWDGWGRGVKAAAQYQQMALDLNANEVVTSQDGAGPKPTLTHAGSRGAADPGMAPIRLESR